MTWGLLRTGDSLNALALFSHSILRAPISIEVRKNKQSSSELLRQIVMDLDACMLVLQ